MTTVVNQVKMKSFPKVIPYAQRKKAERTMKARQRSQPR